MYIRWFRICTTLPTDAEGYEETDNKLQLMVDVRDVAEALVYERPKAEGRYICTAHVATMIILKRNYSDSQLSQEVNICFRD